MPGVPVSPAFGLRRDRHLPLGILASFIVMQHQGINANIMSLGGIAIAIGAMVDAAIVMIENAHKHLERYHHRYGHPPQGREHWEVITHAAAEVGRRCSSRC